ncbi:MAG: pre-peptidase C-terminal domain-containing protein [Cyanobacteria bacterium P01_D01_bin.44]
MVMLPTQTNPFPGLRPFILDEEYLFFGREGQADEMLMRLNRTRFLAVVGTSGSGKSSLVRAGLLPSLYSGFLSQATSSWRIAIMRPGNAPIRNLAQALNQPDILGHETPDAHIYLELTETTLRRGDLGLVEVVKQARMEPRESLLVVADQFEELFRFKRTASNLDTDDEATAFVKLLLEAFQQRRVPIYVVLTMRSDFLGDCAQFRGLPEAINDSQYLIPRMTRDQRRSAIEGPVAVGGAKITSRLVNRLLNDMGDSPDQLPILQHALMRTWENWQSDYAPDESIDLRHYQAIGRMAGALSQHADEIYLGLDARSQTVAEKLFKCLTEKGPDNREIRCPSKLGTVCAIAEAAPEEAMDVVEVFRAAGRSFLMPPVGTALTVETVLDISHESLMRIWQRLQDWLDDEAQSAQIYRRVAETAALYQAKQAGYLHDPDLTIALRWREQMQPNEVWAVRYAPNFKQAVKFLDKSAAVRDAEIAEKEAAQKRQISLLRRFVAGLLIAFFLVAGAAAYALQQKRRAELAEADLRQKNIVLEDAHNTALALEEEARGEAKRAQAARQRAVTQREAAEQAKEAAEQAQNDTLVALRRVEETERVAEEQKEAAIEARNQAEVSEKTAQEQKEAAIEARNLALEATRVAEDQKRLVELERDRAIDAEIAAQLATIEAGIANENLAAVATSFRSESSFLSGQEIPALLTSIIQGEKIINAESKVSLEHSIRFVGTLRKIVDNIRQTNLLEGHTAAVSDVIFNPDPTSPFAIASASQDQTINLWDNHGRLLETINVRSGVNDIAFSPDGTKLLSADHNGTLKIFDLSSILTDSSPIPPTTTGQLTAQDDTLSDGSFYDAYPIQDRAGQFIQIHLESEDFDTYLGFKDPQNDIILAENDDDGVGTNSYLEVRVPDESTYEILVNSYSAGESGAYTLHVQPSALIAEVQNIHKGEIRELSHTPDNASAIAATTGQDGVLRLWSVATSEIGALNVIQQPLLEPQAAELQNRGSNRLADRKTFYDEYLIEGIAGQSVRIQLESKSFDTYLRLKDPNGQIIEENDDSDFGLGISRNSLIETVLPQDGQYSITVTTYAPDATGTYQLTAVEPILNHSFSPDGNLIATANQGRTVRIWGLDGTLLNEFPIETEGINTLDFSPSGQNLIVTDGDGIALVLDRDGNIVRDFAGGLSNISNLSFSPDEAMIMTASAEGTLLWAFSGQKLSTFPSNSPIESTSFSLDGQSIAAAQSNGALSLWNINPVGHQHLELETHAIRALAFDTPQQEIATVGLRPDLSSDSKQADDIAIHLWNSVNTSTLKHEIFLSESGFINISLDSLDLHRGQDVIAIGLTTLDSVLDDSEIDYRIAFWDLLGTKINEFGVSRQTRVIKLDNNAERVAVGYQSGGLEIYGLEGTKYEAGHQDLSELNVEDISFSADSHTVGVVTVGGELTVWSLLESETLPLGPFQGQSGQLTSLAFHPQSNEILAVATVTGTVELWQIQKDGTREVLQTLPSKNFGRLVRVSFDDTGNALSAISADGKVALWNLNIQETLQEGCQWLEAYFAASVAPSSDAQMACDRIQSQPIATRHIPTDLSFLESQTPLRPFSVNHLWWQFHQWLGILARLSLF